MRHRAFTLIELLVVVSIIAVLAGMLLPAVSLVMASARQARCASNQRQIHLALAGYEADQGVPPRIAGDGTAAWPDPKWNQQCVSYLDARDWQTWAAQPGQKLPPVFFDPAAAVHNATRGDIGVLYDDSVGPIRNGKESLPVQQLARPSATPVLLTAQQFLADGRATGSWFVRNDAAPSGTTTIPEASDRHRGSTLVVYADGHGAAMRRAAFYAESMPFQNR